MTSNEFDHAWQGFVPEVVRAITEEWHASHALVSWRREPSGSLVTDLDIRIDVAVRRVFTAWFGASRCLSEELGLMSNGDEPSDYIGVIDPIDGTASLIAGRPDWWVSLGVVRAGLAVAGLLVQPERGVFHDSAIDRTSASSATGSLGLSPDRIPAAQKLGAHVVRTPHSANKVAAVLDGRCDAAAFIPSPRSPRWRSWDMAAASAIARNAGVLIRMLDGGDLSFDDLQHDETRSWICARNEEAFAAAEPIVRRLTQP